MKKKSKFKIINELGIVEAVEPNSDRWFEIQYNKNRIERLNQQLAEKDQEIEELKYKIEMLQFALDIIELDKLNPLSPYKWSKKRSNIKRSSENDN